MYIAKLGQNICIWENKAYHVPNTNIYDGVLNIFVNQTISWCVQLERMPCERKRIAHAARVPFLHQHPQLGAPGSIPDFSFIII